MKFDIFQNKLKVSGPGMIFMQSRPITLDITPLEQGAPAAEQSVNAEDKMEFIGQYDNGQQAQMYSYIQQIQEQHDTGASGSSSSMRNSVSLPPPPPAALLQQQASQRASLSAHHAATLSSMMAAQDESNNGEYTSSNQALLQQDTNTQETNSANQAL